MGLNDKPAVGRLQEVAAGHAPKFRSELNLSREAPKMFDN